MERFYRWMAWKLPRRVVLWSAIRLIAFATQGKYSSTIVPELTAMDAVKRWTSETDGHRILDARRIIGT